MLRRQTGFTLLEVLVAVVIISLGMLGVAALLVTVQKAETSSYIQQQAVQTAYDMLDRMRANLSGVQAGYYNGSYSGTSTASTNCNASVCSSQQLADYDTSQWTSDIDALPQGAGTVASAVSSNGNVNVTVTVSWSDSPAQSAIEKSGSSNRSFTLTTVM